CGLDLLLGRPLTLAKVIHVADTGVGDVESALGDARILERRGQQLEQLRADLYRLRCGQRVHLRDFARRLVDAHGLIDVPHLIHDRIDGLLAPLLVLILGPQLYEDPRAHDAVDAARQPCRVRRGCAQRDQQQQRAHVCAHTLSRPAGSSKPFCASHSRLNSRERYFEPVSHSTVTTVWPGPRSRATCTAAATLMPLVLLTNSPSSRSSR